MPQQDTNKEMSIMECKLRSFYIFKSSLTHKEGDEKKKILFYHPSVDLDTKIKDIGLSEAIIKFTGTFTADDASCKALHTQKTTQIFHQPEKDFWMVMTVNVPYETKQKDGIDVLEYKGGEVHDTVYRAIVRQSHQMFKLFAGTFEMNFIGDTEEEQTENLKMKLELFFTKYILTLKLQSFDVVDAIRSIQYLPLEKSLFLRIHSFINMIEATFPTVENCIFMYNEQLVWSEINSTDLYSIHEFLIGTLFPKASQSDLQGGSLRRSYSIENNCLGSFITGPENFENSTKSPKVYINNNGKLVCYNLIVYRALSATICLFVEGQNQIGDDFYLELHSFMGPQLSSIASEIGETYSKATTIPYKTPPDIADSLAPKFLFINELNLRHQGTMYLDHRRPKNTVIPTNVMNLIADLYNDKAINSGGKFEEIYLKAVNDYWIVKKTSNWRQFYVIIHNSKATLLDVTNEAKKIFDQHVTNVFFEK